MDLLWTPTAIAFRDEVRAILDERLTADLRRVNNDPPPDGYVNGASWQPVAGEQARALVERIAAGRLTARSENGISLFLVDVAEVPELELHGYRTIDDRRAADLVLASLRLPADVLLGREGDVSRYADLTRG